MLLANQVKHNVNNIWLRISRRCPSRFYSRPSAIIFNFNAMQLVVKSYGNKANNAKNTTYFFIKSLTKFYFQKAHSQWHLAEFGTTLQRSLLTHLLQKISPKRPKTVPLSLEQTSFFRSLFKQVPCVASLARKKAKIIWKWNGYNVCVISLARVGRLVA